MKRHYLLATLLLLSVFTAFLSCGSDDPAEYKELSPVVMDLTTVPYPKLSDYKFFTGELKSLTPAHKVLPYDLNSSLFTDYALKKRFVWMPEGAQASYGTDGEVLNLPAGAALIKNFYYENVLPENLTKIIETRIMIKKANGWIFANYVWNDEQTEAFLDLNGSVKNITWLKDGEENTVTYSIPDKDECLRCHNSNNTPLPIGPKPQNLNKLYNYNGVITNQLAHWKNQGYISNVLPQTISSTVDWKDTSYPLDVRVRSYLDINCAHCHNPAGDANEMHINLAFNQTTDPSNLGICEIVHDITPGQAYIISGQDTEDSWLYYRMGDSRNKADMMPPVGRSVTDKDGRALIEQWINSLTPCP